MSDQQDPGAELMAGFVTFLKEKVRRANLKRDDADYEPMTAAESNVIRQLLSDNSVTLASVRKGNFGELARRVAEEFPVDEDGEVSYQ